MRRRKETQPYRLQIASFFGPVTIPVSILFPKIMTGSKVPTLRLQELLFPKYYPPVEASITLFPGEESTKDEVLKAFEWIKVIHNEKVTKNKKGGKGKEFEKVVAAEKVRERVFDGREAFLLGKAWVCKSTQHE